PNCSRNSTNRAETCPRQTPYFCGACGRRPAPARDRDSSFRGRPYSVYRWGVFSRPDRGGDPNQVRNRRPIGERLGGVHQWGGDFQSLSYPEIASLSEECLHALRGRRTALVTSAEFGGMPAVAGLLHPGLPKEGWPAASIGSRP